ncbi:hypothetical protein Goshw_008198 [Gossypium schwendimanii]|uniref:Signal recognition particle 19 kDa protein n=1 Tax=Gossypium schwendimanii TaxID=34291 RepID=A0A7J9MAB3_GOSSC|nr:hypothetical protein [Gossypium schwendimanii]
MNGEVPNIKKWVVFYPVYINSKKTVAEGRRISLAKACENPTCVEIADCCNHLKVPNAIEVCSCVICDAIVEMWRRMRPYLIDKAYPRDFMQRGRVRIQLKKEDGTLWNPAISSRKQLMLQVAELVPRHPGRTKKQEAPSTSSAAAGSSKPGKGGRKKR